MIVISVTFLFNLMAFERKNQATNMDLDSNEGELKYSRNEITKVKHPK